MRLSSLVSLLQSRASSGDGTERGYTFLIDGDEAEETMSFARLEARARAIGARLQAEAQPRARALLVYPPGLEFVSGFFGSLFGDTVAVPLYPPDPMRLERSLKRFVAVVEDARPAFVLTTSAILEMAEALFEKAPALRSLRWIATDVIDSALADQWKDSHANEEHCAFLQYTSGSTGSPKGVVLSHRNLLHNSALIQQAFGSSVDSRAVIWLPPYHDMGLIGGILQPLHGGFPVTLMSPLSFLERPMRWLRAMSRSRATISGGPNFAFELCVRKSTPEERSQLDLSAWDVAFNGAEPIRAETLTRFADAFAVSGFRPEAFHPCYGLAESTLMVSGGRRLAGHRTLRVQRAALQRDEVTPAPQDDSDARVLVAVGEAVGDTVVTVVDPTSRIRCPPGRVGEIWVRSPSVAGGYFGKEAETERTFRATLHDGEGAFLRTGDLAFVDDGALYVVGRSKDLIIIRGRNHHPPDLELTAERSHPAVRPGSSAAFATSVDGDERAVLVAEVGKAAPVDPEEVGEAIRRAIAEEHGLQLYGVVLVKPGSVPKTSSGKIERYACRQLLEEGRLPQIASSFLGAGPEAIVEGAPAGPRGVDAVWSAPTESRLPVLLDWMRAVTAELLRVPAEAVDVSSPLTTLGLDSVMAIELQAQLDDSLGVSVPAVRWLRGDTLAQVAQTLSATLVAPDRSPATHATPPVAEYPLSAGQGALWFLQQLAPEGAAYNVSVAGRVQQPFDAEALRGACEALVERHPSLRTTVVLRNGTPFQRVGAVQLDASVVDASSWTDPMLRARVAEEAHRPFRLEHETPFRLRLFRREEGDGVVLLVAHHIAVDLWSLSVLLEELGETYTALRESRAPRLPPIGASFAEHVLAEQRALADRAFEGDWEHWQRALAAPLPILELPTDRPRPRLQRFRGAAVPVSLGTSLTQKLRTLARAQGATLNSLLLSAFHLLLARTSGQHDVLVGTPSAGRTASAHASTVGYYVHPLVVRASTASNPSFLTFWSHVRESLLEGMAHERLPFPVLVDRIGAVRSADRPPVFQALFALERPHRLPQLAAFLAADGGEPLNLGALSLTAFPIEQRASQFDLSLVLFDGAGALSGRLQFNTDLFDEATIVAVKRHLHALLESISADPSLPVSSLSLISEEERTALLFTWNATHGEVDETRSLHHHVAVLATRQPDAIAVEMGDRRLSYGELDAASNRLARHLRALGATHEVRVGVCLERSIDWVVSTLAVLKAGATYLPLDPALPPARLQWMMEDAGARVVVTSSALAGRVPAHVRQVCVDVEAPAIAAHDGAGFDVEIHPDTAAYVIYTSGSTGRPKGVVVPHRGLSNLAAAQRATYGTSAAERVVQFASCSFDASIAELSLPLTAGATLCLPPPGPVLPGPELVAWLREQRISTATFPPSLLAHLPPDGLGTLSTVHSAGEACPREVVARWAPGRRFFNVYGPTEASVWTTAARLEATDAAGASARPGIGTPILNTRVYVLDGNFDLAPVGIVGELCIAGAGLARGYLGRPELTAERFIPDPFGGPGERLYRTGDLARMRSDGTLEFVGRNDTQVKVRGFRVELEEIEGALRQHEDVEQAVVLAQPASSGELRLVAFLVGRKVVPLETLRAFARSSLPEYMLPSQATWIDAIPLTASGKIDRHALARLTPAEREVRPNEAPSSDMERLLTEVFAEALGHAQVGVNDHFFEALGGNSLAVVRARAILSSRAQLDVPLTAFFEHPTIHSLAKHLSGDRVTEDTSKTHQERAAERARRLQQRRTVRGK